MPPNLKEIAEPARDAAHRLTAALEDEQRVARFLDRYVREYDRPGLRESPFRYRELLATVTREALLAAAARLLADLPRHLTRRQKPVLRGPQAEAADAFREGFLAALGEAMAWPAGERDEFRRDLEIYSQLAARTARLGGPRRPGDPPEGPFVDRCALLLDPSMLDAARRSASRFQAELEELADEVLKSALRARGRARK